MPSDARSDIRGSILEGRHGVGARIGVGGTDVVFEATRLCDEAELVVETPRPVYAHDPERVRYVHRDIEPEHILLGRRPDGNLHVSLLDLGVCGG